MRVRIAGRLVAKRMRFTVLQDPERPHSALRAATESGPDAFKDWDIGDTLGATGVLFRTKTGELTVRAESARILVKALRPLPDKFHGLADVEMRYRQRYVDLIVTERSREVFRLRTALLRELRRMLDERGFMEVETPMLQAIPGGALARPFVTHHHALDMEMSICASPRSCTSSASSWAVSSACTRSIATSATRACRRSTTPSSRCSSCIRRTRTTKTS